MMTINVNGQGVTFDADELSLGEIFHMYEDGEIKLALETKSLDLSADRVTNLACLAIAGAPVINLLVEQAEGHEWVVIGGAGNLRALLRFAGILKIEDGGDGNLPSLEGSEAFPSVRGKTWSSPDGEGGTIGQLGRFSIRRSKCTVRIVAFPDSMDKVLRNSILDAVFDC